MEAAEIQVETDEALREVAERWWLVALLGAVTAVLGALIIIRPVAGVFALAVFIAAALLVSGIGQIAASGRWPRPWVPVAWGLASIAAGIIAAVWPAISLTALALVIGIVLIVRGLLGIAGNLADRPHLWGAWLAVAVLEVAVGVAAIAWPGITILALSIIIGIDLLLAGLLELGVAFRLRSA